MIRWLASFPRSGNSYFRVVSKNLFNYEIYSIYPEKRAPVENVGGLDHVTEAQEIYLLKTHEVKPDNNPAIYLVRDGRDVLVSYTWYSLTSRADPNRDVSEKEYHDKLKAVILTDEYGGWSGNVLAWIRRSVLTPIVKFEDLIIKPEDVVGESLKSMGLQVTRRPSGNLLSFETLHGKDPHLFRKGKVGDWRTKMTDDLHELFWKKHGQAMDVLGYVR
jgi:hypothetical protein